MKKSNKEFVKLVNRLKEKHGWNQRDIAHECYTTESVISECLYGKRGYHGTKFVGRLQWFVDELEGVHRKREREEAKKELEEIHYCIDCRNYHVGDRHLQA